jgi:hypothetical protein
MRRMTNTYVITVFIKLNQYKLIYENNFWVMTALVCLSTGNKNNLMDGLTNYYFVNP